METEDKLIRLLIVEQDSHRAEQITSSLRATGMQVRAEFAEDGEDMSELLAGRTFDLVLFSTALADFALDQASTLIEQSGQQLALIALVRQPDTAVIVDAIDRGARDAVDSGSIEHLIQVIGREAHAVSQARRAARLEQQFQESEKRCQNLLANSRDAVAYVHEGMYVYANEVYMKMFGHADFGELEGTPIIDMVDPSQQEELKSLLRDFASPEGEPLEMALKLLHSNGDALSTTLEFAAASYDGEPCTQILIRSQTDTRELEEQISYLHKHDLISGLYNRQYFIDELKAAIGRAAESAEQFAIVYIGIDNFQSIRDTIGISGCDILIGDVAKIISEYAVPDYTVARFGAYSYICLGKLADRNAAEAFAAKIPKLVEQHICEVGKHSISVTCSAAVLFIDEHSPNNPNALIMRAEKTCEEAQAEGGNQARTYVLKAGEMTRDEEDGATASLIKDALNNNRIKVLYQPLVAVKGQSGERYQSSVEVTTEDGRRLRESGYMGAAERTGTAKMLDRWKILHAIRRIAETGKDGRVISFFVPLSADSIRDPGLAEWVSENIAKNGADARQLVFMVDEAQALGQLKATQTLARDLKQLGCQFAIDEFGAGINPFQLVKHVDADYVRINQSFTSDVVVSEKNREAIRELSRRAVEMGLQTIAPGVSDAAILSVLWTLDVDFIQGDFLQVPQGELEYDFSSV